MVAGLAWAYVHFGKLSQVGAVLYGVKPVVIAVILQALWGLGRTAVKTRFLGALGLVCVGFAFWGLHPLLLLLLAGAAACVPLGRNLRLTIPSLSAAAGSIGGAAAVASFSLTSLFLVFLKIGAVVFGSGYVLLAFLRTDLVRFMLGPT
jgi:chromate transporter